jgi:hypothetical protein
MRNFDFDLGAKISSLYKDGYTVTAISNILQVSGDRVRRWLKYDNAYRISARFSAPSYLNEEQNSMLIGLMLGDGSLIKSKPNHNARLKVDRQLQDKDYLQWNYKVFEEFSSSGLSRIDTFDKRYDKNYSVYHFATCTNKLFTKLSDLWYPNNKRKIVPININIDPLALAVWFLDDGSIYKSGQRNFLISLMTCGFTYEENKLLLDKLKNSYGIEGKISLKDNKYHYLRFDVTNSSIIIKLIDKHIPVNVMKRKTIWRKI